MELTVSRMNSVLVIDDDIDLCELLAKYLRREHFEIETVNDGEQAIPRALSGHHSLIILDVMLPGLSGFEVLRRIRSQSAIPVLMLTARGEDIDRIVGLEMGADDYLAKPFNPRVLLARVRAILRRTKSTSAELPLNPETQVVASGDVELNLTSRAALCDGLPVVLTSAEFDLLLYFLRSAGRVITRDELVREVLGRDFSPLDRSLDVHVSNLRKKLGPRAGRMERIKPVRGVGYIYTIVNDD
jgi:two-component system response regulator CpxR